MGDLCADVIRWAEVRQVVRDQAGEGGQESRGPCLTQPAH